MCVICLKAIGCGMRLILYTNLKIAGYWMKALSVQRMGGLISSTPNGDGNPKIATCQGIFPINFPFFINWDFVFLVTKHGRQDFGLLITPRLILDKALKRNHLI